VAVVGLPPAFIPPVVVLPAASAVVPAVAGAAATAVALPVLPLVGAVVVGAAVAGAAALAVSAVINGQKWGYLNDRQGAAQPGNWQGPVDQNVVANSVVTGQGDGSGYLNPVVSNPQFWSNPYGFAAPPDNASVSTWYQWVPPVFGFGWGWTYRYSWQANGQTVQGYVTAGILGNPATDSRTFEQGPLMEVFWARQGTPDPLPEAEPVYPQPSPNPQVVPEPLPEPQKLPAQPSPLPLVVPAVPNADPVAPPATPPGTPTTTPATRPATRPKAPPVPGPLPITTPKPNAQPTENGALVPQAPPPPVKTPVDAHIVNGQPVRSPGPQPTPVGIAKEVGRIEEKLAQLIDPKRAGNGDLTDRLGLIWQAVQALIEAIKSQAEAGSYQLSSPCELDGNNNRIVRTVNFDGAFTSLGVISNKVDALADLLQVHKDLKQPICRQLPPVGQPVTVNFVQTD
jgi:hypothetical protein